jgi:hypothetical protein
MPNAASVRIQAHSNLEKIPKVAVLGHAANPCPTLMTLVRRLFSQQVCRKSADRGKQISAVLAVGPGES